MIRWLMVRVRLDPWLVEFGPKAEESVEARDVEALLDTLEARHPRLRLKLRDETGAVRRFVRIFLDGEALEPAACLSTPLAPSASVDILHSIAGG